MSESSFEMEGARSSDWRLRAAGRVEHPRVSQWNAVFVIQDRKIVGRARGGAHREGGQDRCEMLANLLQELREPGFVPREVEEGFGSSHER
jgi:hypothetical protein